MSLTLDDIRSCRDQLNAAIAAIEAVEPLVAALRPPAPEVVVARQPVQSSDTGAPGSNPPALASSDDPKTATVPIFSRENGEIPVEKPENATIGKSESGDSPSPPKGRPGPKPGKPLMTPEERKASRARYQRERRQAQRSATASPAAAKAPTAR
jgi:hypothetical protein